MRARRVCCTIVSDEPRKLACSFSRCLYAWHVSYVLFAKRWPHSSHLNSWQSLPPPTGPCAAFPHSGQDLEGSSAPSSPRTFSLVNTAGAVSGKASARRNIARAYSLRERGLVIVVSPFHYECSPLLKIIEITRSVTLI